LINTGSLNEIGNKLTITCRAALTVSHIQGDFKTNTSRTSQGNFEVIVIIAAACASKDFSDLGNWEISANNHILAEELTHAFSWSNVNDSFILRGAWRSDILLSISNSWWGAWAWRSTSIGTRTGSSIDSINGISSDNLLINIRSIIDDIIHLNRGASLAGKTDVKLVVISTVDDLAIATVDLRNRIALIALKDLLDTIIKAAGNLSIAVDFRDINLDISTIGKSNFLTNGILSTVNLVLVGSKVITIRRALVIHSEISDDLDIGGALKNNIARIINTKSCSFGW